MRLLKALAFVFSLAVPVLAQGAPPGEAAGEPIFLVSVDSAGEPGNESSSVLAVISGDGRFVAFDSYASNLVPNDTNGVPSSINGGDVFVHDLQSGLTERASVSSAGVQGNGYSEGSSGPSISSDGRIVAFVSLATNLVPTDTNATCDIFVRDRLAATTALVSTDSLGNQANGCSSSADVSASGRFVAFLSMASNLVAGDANGVTDIFVHDQTSGGTERVSVDSSGGEANGESLYPSISSDGRYVAFRSAASNLVPGDTNGVPDVFIYDRQTGVTERVSVGSAGVEGNGESDTPDISGDGRFVAFRSTASNLVSGDANGVEDIFIRDRLAGTTERVSVDTFGNDANERSASAPAISSDGRFVAFASLASDLVPGDVNGFEDVFLRDRQASVTEGVSGQGNRGSNNRTGVVNADGTFVVFESSTPDLPGGGAGYEQVYVRDRSVLLPDADGDGIPDAGDNCPSSPNPDQANLDRDLKGDVCDESPMGGEILSDPLQGTVLNEGLWFKRIEADGAITPQADGLHMTLTSANSAGEVYWMAAKSECLIYGNYDARVKLDLLSWPQQGFLSASLMQDFAYVERMTLPGSGEVYGTEMRDGRRITGPADSSVTLRLTRSGNTVTGYYLDSTQTWQLIHSSYADPPYGGPTFLTLQIIGNWATAGADVRWRDFSVTAGDIRCPNTAQPFTPTFALSASNNAPSDPTILPSGGACTLGMPCKVSTTFEIPPGQAMFEGYSIPEGLPDVQAFELAQGTDVPVGTVVGQITISFMSDLGTRSRCDAPVRATLPLVNAAMPASAGGGPDGSGAHLERLSANVWPVQLGWKPAVKQMLASGAQMWARYLAVWNDLGIPGTKTAINILVFKSPGAGWSVLTWADGVWFPNSFWDNCTQFMSRAVYSGQTSGGQTLRRCLMEGTHQFTLVAEAAWSDASASLSGSLNCTLPPLVDGDADGIDSGVDGRMAGGSFVNESASYSNNFTDEHTGGTTSGGIVGRGGMTLTVLDEPNPRGVRVKAAGTGVPATIQACSSAITLEAGQQTVVTCGSTDLVVTNGAPLALPQGSLTGVMPAGSFVVLNQTAPNTISVANQLASWSQVVVGGVTLSPGQSAVLTDMDRDGVAEPPDNCPLLPNTDQSNNDGDLSGDACDLDDDNDMFADVFDNCQFVSNPSQSNNDGDLSGDACDPDDDNDSFSDVIEAFVGTQPLVACGVNAWPVDNNDDHKAGLSDILRYIPVFGTTAPPPPSAYNPRFDLNTDNKIGLSDILTFIPFFNLTCTP